MSRARAVTAAFLLLSAVSPAAVGPQTANPVTRVVAGAAWDDITPPPGVPNGGHSTSGSVARGRWGSLRATAFYFRDGAGQPVVLVSCDLFAIAGAIHQEVSRRTGIPLERLIIAATHTHHGPGNFLSAELYNLLGSKTPGYDPALREFLIARITGVVRAAAADAEASAALTTVDIVSGQLPHTLLRNRSPRVFMRNANAGDILKALGGDIPEDGTTCDMLRNPEEPEEDWDVEGCPRLRAVDRGVTLLRLRRQGGTAAMAVFMSGHPTVLPAATPLASPDVFGIARGALETRASIVAFFNGAEGDITTRRTVRDAIDAARLGSSLAHAVQEVADRGAATPLDISMPSSARLWFARGGDHALDASGRRWSLASSAVGGRAVLGGAEDDGTIFRKAWWVRHKRKTPQGEHGVKLPAFSGLTRRIFPPRMYPQALPVSVVQLGSLSIGALPSELSTAAGFAVRGQLDAPGRTPLLIGLANEYASYAATYEEYQEQDYMGASTMWGPEQAGFFAAAIARLVPAGDPIVGSAGPDAPGRLQSFGPHRLSPARDDRVEGLDRLFGSWPNPERLPHFTYCTAPPDPLPAYRADRVEIVDAEGRTIDRDGVIVLLDRRPSASHAQWTAVWAGPLWYPHVGSFRFRVSGGGRVIESQPFDPNASPPPGACGEP